jgi:hypothetical protein
MSRRARRTCKLILANEDVLTVSRALELVLFMDATFGPAVSGFLRASAARFVALRGIVAPDLNHASVIIGRTMVAARRICWACAADGLAQKMARTESYKELCPSDCVDEQQSTL